MKLESLKDLFVDELKDIYNAENQLIKALPKMGKAATNPDLQSGFEEHLEQTRGQVERLERICEQLEVSPKGKTCVAMQGLIEEGKELIEEDPEPAVLDAGLIAAAQKVEHYEMATYGTLRAWAEQLGLDEAADLLQETFEEEKATDEKLSQLAVSNVNAQAEAGEGEEEAEEGNGRSRAGNGRKQNGRKAASKK